MAKINIKEECTEDELIGRPCTLSIGAKTAKGFQVVSRGKTSLVEREVLWKMAAQNPMAEYYFTLTLKKLREIDKDREKLQEFLVSRLPRIGGKTTNVIVVRLLVDAGDTIQKNDLEYLWDLLNISGNDIAVPPILSWPRMSPFDKEKYKKFVKDFVSLSSSYQPDKLACAIPWGLSRGDIDDVISWYKQVQPQVYLMDFGGKRPFSLSQEMIMSTLLRKATELHGNNYYLYGFDIKPHKLGADELPAENVLLLASGFNAVGPRRTPPRLSPQMLERIRSAGIRPVTESVRVFSSDDYGYHKLADPILLKQFGDWIPTLQSTKGQVTIEAINDVGNAPLFQKLGKAFNFAMQGPEASVLAKKVDEGKLKAHLLSKDQAKKVVPRIEKIKRRTFGKRESP